MDNMIRAGHRMMAITVEAAIYAGTGVKKSSPLDNKYIPVICGGAGLVLGLGVSPVRGHAGFPATDPITAAAVCVVSGLRPRASIRL